MELDRIEQLEFQTISKEVMDLLIVVSGYENRCTFLAHHLPIDPLNKVVFAFKEKQTEGFRPFNDQYFSTHHFDFHDATGGHGAEVVEKLESLLENARKDHLKILVDYSCMTKEWYAAIINYFVNFDLDAKEIELYFAYTPSTYEKPRRKRFFKKFARTLVTEPIESTGKPVSLVLGLGYDPVQAQELINRIRPAQTFAFYSDPSIDDRFVKEVEKVNKFLLKDLESDHVIKYPLNDMRAINLSLKQLCMDLRLQSQVILAPLGPKPFALACMLLSARYPDIWVWRVHTGQNDAYYKWKPYGKPLICKAVFKTLTEDRWA